ncbi:MAG: hypothetical protein E6J08_10320 [Chloroflexi bacterium]|nr:MAG: hypothetical protein E6J08_10320 [Chloroflexota bacterium]
MSKVALATALGLLLFFTYLTGIRPAYAFAYGLCLLFVIAWAWPRLAIRGVTVTRRVDPGTPTVGEVYEETFEVRRKGWVPRRAASTAAGVGSPSGPRRCACASLSAFSSASSSSPSELRSWSIRESALCLT